MIYWAQPQTTNLQAPPLKIYGVTVRPYGIILTWNYSTFYIHNLKVKYLEILIEKMIDWDIEWHKMTGIGLAMDQSLEDVT